MFQCCSFLCWVERAHPALEPPFLSQDTPTSSPTVTGFIQDITIFLQISVYFSDSTTDSVVVDAPAHDADIDMSQDSTDATDLLATGAAIVPRTPRSSPPQPATPPSQPMPSSSQEEEDTPSPAKQVGVKRKHRSNPVKRTVSQAHSSSDEAESDSDIQFPAPDRKRPSRPPLVHISEPQVPPALLAGMVPPLSSKLQHRASQTNRRASFATRQEFLVREFIHVPTNLAREITDLITTNAARTTTGQAPNVSLIQDEVQALLARHNVLESTAAENILPPDQVLKYDAAAEAIAQQHREHGQPPQDDKPVPVSQAPPVSSTTAAAIAAAARDPPPPPPLLPSATSQRSRGRPSLSNAQLGASLPPARSYSHGRQQSNKERKKDDYKREQAKLMAPLSIEGYVPARTEAPGAPLEIPLTHLSAQAAGRPYMATPLDERRAMEMDPVSQPKPVVRPLLQPDAPAPQLIALTGPPPPSSGMPSPASSAPHTPPAFHNYSSRAASPSVFHQDAYTAPITTPGVPIPNNPGARCYQEYHEDRRQQHIQDRIQQAHDALAGAQRQLDQALAQRSRSMSSVPDRSTDMDCYPDSSSWDDRVQQDEDARSRAAVSRPRPPSYAAVTQAPTPQPPRDEPVRKLYARSRCLAPSYPGNVTASYPRQETWMDYDASEPVAPYDSRTMNIVPFSGKDDPLSNLFTCHPLLQVDGRSFGSSEVLYQIYKADFFNCPEMRHELQLIPADRPYMITAVKKKFQKQFDRDPVRCALWDQVRIAVMSLALQIKYEQNAEFATAVHKVLPSLREVYFVETTTNDFWGCGWKKSDFARERPSTAQFTGRNVMGKLLTLLRLHATLVPP